MQQAAVFARGNNTGFGFRGVWPSETRDSSEILALWHIKGTCTAQDHIQDLIDDWTSLVSLTRLAKQEALLFDCAVARDAAAIWIWLTPVLHQASS